MGYWTSRDFIGPVERGNNRLNAPRPYVIKESDFHDCEFYKPAVMCANLAGIANMSAWYSVCFWRRVAEQGPTVACQQAEALSEYLRDEEPCKYSLDLAISAIAVLNLAGFIKASEKIFIPDVIPDEPGTEIHWWEYENILLPVDGELAEFDWGGGAVNGGMSLCHHGVRVHTSISFRNWTLFVKGGSDREFARFAYLYGGTAMQKVIRSYLGSNVEELLLA